MDTWHPVFLTWVIGGCVWLGRLVGSDNLGAALYTLIQTALMAFALSSVLRLMRALRLNRTARLAAAAFFALLPIWGGYAQFISKDTLYTSVLLLFTLCLIRLVLAREGRLSVQTGREAAGLFVWGLLTCLMRSNGLYVILPTAVFAFAFVVRGRARLAVGGALAGAVGLAPCCFPMCCCPRWACATRRPAACIPSAFSRARGFCVIMPARLRPRNMPKSTACWTRKIWLSCTSRGFPIR